jgi:hypothetical protein
VGRIRATVAAYKDGATPLHLTVRPGLTYRECEDTLCPAGLATGVLDPLMPTDETTTATANSVTVAARNRFGVSHVT